MIAPPPFHTFASVLHAETEEARFVQSLTHQQCERLITRVHEVAKRCTNEKAGRDVRLRRLWPFYKVFSENELATRASPVQCPSCPYSHRRTMMSPIRAKRWRNLAVSIIQETLNQYLQGEEDIVDAFDTILPAEAALQSNSEQETGDIGIEWKHWVTFLSSFKLIAQVHQLYRTTYLYDGPTA